MIFGELLGRARDSLGILSAEARGDAEQLLSICDELEAANARPTAQRELLGLVERLARRSSAAIPYATLGRAALAQLGGSFADREGLVLEANSNFNLLGL